VSTELLSHGELAFVYSQCQEFYVPIINANDSVYNKFVRKLTNKETDNERQRTVLLAL